MTKSMDILFVYMNLPINQVQTQILSPCIFVYCVYLHLTQNNKVLVIT